MATAAVPPEKSESETTPQIYKRVNYTLISAIYGDEDITEKLKTFNLQSRLYKVSDVLNDIFEAGKELSLTFQRDPTAPRSNVVMHVFSWGPGGDSGGQLDDVQFSCTYHSPENILIPPMSSPMSFYNTNKGGCVVPDE